MVTIKIEAGGFNLFSCLMAASVWAETNTKLAYKICLWIKCCKTRGQKAALIMEKEPLFSHSLTRLPLPDNLLFTLTHTKFLGVPGGHKHTRHSFLFKLGMKGILMAKSPELFFLVLLIFERGLLIFFLLSLTLMVCARVSDRGREKDIM